MADFEVTGSFDYTACQGDSFDNLALQAYGDERLASVIAGANPAYIDVLAFDGGEEIAIPTIDREPDAAPAPPWRE